MLAMQRQTIVHLEDIRYVCIQCTHCTTRVILDMKETHRMAVQYDGFTPKSCPGCREDYDSATQPNVNAMQKAYAALLAISGRVSFHGEPELSPCQAQ